MPRVNAKNNIKNTQTTAILILSSSDTYSFLSLSYAGLYITCAIIHNTAIINNINMHAKIFIISYLIISQQLVELL